MKYVVYAQNPSLIQIYQRVAMKISSKYSKPHDIKIDRNSRELQSFAIVGCLKDILHECTFLGQVSTNEKR